MNLSINTEIKNKILNVINKDETYDDYLEAYYVYLHMVNDSISAFIKKCPMIFTNRKIK